MNAEIGLNLGAFGYPSYEPFAFWGDNTRLADLVAHANAGRARPPAAPNSALP
jgi:hypothetical protein